MGAAEHLSSYQLVAVGRDVVWKISDEVAVDLTHRPGQQVITQMVDILAAFRGPRDREVVPLYRPRPGVAVDPEVRGGYPGIAGTRVPYDMVASLLEDGVIAEEVAGFYPGVSPLAAWERSSSHGKSTATVSRSALDRAMKRLLDEDVLVQLVEPLH